MRTIEVSEVTRLVRQLCIDANYYLPADLRQAFVDGQNAEESPLGKTIFGEMIANCDLARENNVPVCQDTGMAIVFAEIGQDVHLTGGSFEDAVTEGVRRGYIDGYLRLSVVGDPLRRENTNDNTPCILYTSVVPGDKVKITQTGCRTTERLNLCRVVMCLVLKVYKPLLGHAVHLDRNDNRAGIDLIGFLLIHQLAFFFEALHRH